MHKLREYAVIYEGDETLPGPASTALEFDAPFCDTRRRVAAYGVVDALRLWNEDRELGEFALEIYAVRRVGKTKVKRYVVTDTEIRRLR